MENDVDIYTISKMMGHKSIKTTEIYLQKLPTKAKLKYSKEAASVYKKAA
jgi:integrase